MIKITVDNVLLLHKSVQRRYSEVAKGRVDQNKIASIIDKTFMTVYDQPLYDTVFKQAASLMEGIIRLHPFSDGNKRTALLVAYSFLAINDRFMVVPLNTIRFMVDIAQSTSRTSEEVDELIVNIATWLEERTATNRGDYNDLLAKYINKPVQKLFLLSLTGVGIIYVGRKIKYWFATDTHPEYAKSIRQTMSFLLGLTRNSARAASHIP